MIRAAIDRPTRWLVATLVVVGTLLRFRGLDFGLPYTQARPDETFIIDQARAILSGRLPQFYDYPWLFLWIVALAYLGYFTWGFIAGTFHSLTETLASWPIHWEPFFLLPRAISATAGTLSILTIYRLGRQVRNEATGVVSALFLTFAFMHVLNSHFGTTDVVMVGLILCAITLILDADRTQRIPTFAAAGAVAGLATATKYNAVFLVVPMLVSYTLTVIDSSVKRDALLNPRIVYFGVCFALTFAIGVPFVVLAPTPFLAAMRELAHALSVGNEGLELTNGWVYQLAFSLRYGLGLPLLATGLAGGVVMFWKTPRTAALLLSFPIAYYAITGTIRLIFFRYTLPLVPFLCVTSAYLVCVAGDYFAAQWAVPDRRRSVSRLVTTGIALAIVATSIARAVAVDRVLGADDNRVVVARWFGEHVPAGSSLLQSGSRYGLVQFWDRQLGYKEWGWTGDAFRIAGRLPAADERPDWIVLQQSPLPSGTQPIVTEFLKSGYTLAADFKALTISDETVFDRQDAFFVPYAGLDQVVRPGPNFFVYRRDGAPMNAGAVTHGP